MRFEFATAGRIVFGQGVLREAGPLAKQFGVRALIVTGRDARRSESLSAVLGQHGVHSVAAASARSVNERGRRI